LGNGRNFGFKVKLEYTYRPTATNVALWQCLRAIGKTLGLQPKVVYWIYISVVRPILTYAAVLWWKKTTQSSVVQKINRLQRLAGMCVTGSIYAGYQSNLTNTNDGRMDGFWVVEMKSPVRGPRLGPNVHTTDVKKEESEGMGKKKEKGFVGTGLRDLNQIFHFQRQTLRL
jgi:hypothetical protein